MSSMVNGPVVIDECDFHEATQDFVNWVASEGGTAGDASDAGMVALCFIAILEERWLLEIDWGEDELDGDESFYSFVCSTGKAARNV